jgi:hypothetical protein
MCSTALLLVPNLDATFDCELMTADHGAVVVSEELKAGDCRILDLDTSLRVGGLDDAHRTYLVFHRERVFRDKSRQAVGRAGIWTISTEALSTHTDLNGSHRQK